jgi:HD superfamily phosphohydrolase
MKKKVERIRDPIHNIIEFNIGKSFERVLWSVIQSSQFQRLRRIKQLGFSDFVYPGATHSRLAHSVGTFHTGRQLMKVIRSYLGDDFEERPAQVALAACLTHDLGHGPLSHAFQTVVSRSCLVFPEHEIVSQKIIMILAETFKPLGAGFAQEVADLVARTAHSATAPPETIYDAVVSSQFDADRLDYMRRDRIMAGSLHGAIDYDWLLANLEIEHLPLREDGTDSREVPTFVVGRKAIHAAEAYVLALFQLYPTIYFHKATRGAEAVFVELMTRVVSNLRSAPQRKRVLRLDHPISGFAREPDVERFLALDDTVCWGTLWQLRDAADETIAALATRLLDRKLLHCFDVREVIQRKLRSTIPRAELDDYVDYVLAALENKVELYRKTSGKLILYDKYERSPYQSFTTGQSPLNQIMARDATGKTHDLAELSPLVAAVRKFKVNRYYFDRDDRACASAMDRLVDDCLRRPDDRV